MANQQLLDYVQQQIAEGTTEKDIKKTLLQNGWEDVDVDEALSILRVPVSTPSDSKSSSYTVWIIGIVILILAVGGGVLAYVLVAEKSVTTQGVTDEENITDISTITGDVITEDSAVVTEKATGIEVDWGEFIKTNDEFFGDRWETKITIRNKQNKMIVLDAVGEGKKLKWTWRKEEIIKSRDSETVSLGINLKFPAFDKKMVAINVYECKKLEQNIADELCVVNFGFDGILSPWQTLKKYKEAGNPIQPTSVFTKYYNFNSLESPPLEISEGEYLN